MDRAAAYSKNGEYESAIDDCKKAIELDSNYTKAYYRLGTAYVNVMDNDAALDAFQRGLKVDMGQGGKMSLAFQREINQLSGTPETPQMPSLDNMQIPQGMEGLLSNPEALQNMMTPEMIDKLQENPEIAAMKEDPKVIAGMQDIEQNGMMAGLKYLNDPDIMAKLQTIMGSGLFQ